MSTADHFIEKGIKIGREQEEERRSRLVVQKMLLADKLSVAEIAEYADVTEAFVLQVKEQIQHS